MLVPQLPLCLADLRHALIGIDDFAAGGEPDPLMLLHVGDGALEILDAQGLPGNHRV
jgi:hypothetical protein